MRTSIDPSTLEYFPYQLLLIFDVGLDSVEVVDDVGEDDGVPPTRSVVRKAPAKCTN